MVFFHKMATAIFPVPHALPESFHSPSSGGACLLLLTPWGHVMALINRRWKWHMWLPRLGLNGSIAFPWISLFWNMWLWSHELPYKKSGYQKPPCGMITGNDAQGAPAVPVPSCLSLSSVGTDMKASLQMSPAPATIWLKLPETLSKNHLAEPCQPAEPWDTITNDGCYKGIDK